jgi:hypothetical protein
MQVLAEAILCFAIHDGQIAIKDYIVSMITG